jgi:hypothetical protein
MILFMAAGSHPVPMLLCATNLGNPGAVDSHNPEHIALELAETTKKKKLDFVLFYSN